MSNAKTKTYTTTELASICSVSVASISSYIKKHKLKQVIIMQNTMTKVSCSSSKITIIVSLNRT